MHCLIGCLALLTPRVALVMVWLFGHGYLGRAYQSALWPVLGFFFLPLTTLTYAYAHNATGGAVSGFHLALVVIAVLIDLGLIGSGEAGRRSRQRRGR